ncbi:MAG: hypothetical protein RL846_15700 [Deltaproteobacteria bacterium]|jgi:hypothetical protein
MMRRILLTAGFLAFGISAEVADGAQLGRITGELRFPSCNQTAPGLEVCAVPVDEDGDPTCTSDFAPNAAGQLTYTLEVRPGAYHVYATTPTIEDGRYRAFFSQAVRCGLEVACRDHTPVTIDVRAGKTVDGVHPSDWVAGFDEPEPAPLTN